MIGLAYVLMTVGAEFHPHSIPPKDVPREALQPPAIQPPTEPEAPRPVVRQASVPAEQLTGLTIKQALQRVSSHRI
jgi:hypothetical protein